MTTYRQGETIKFTFRFYQQSSDTILEDQDYVKFYLINSDTHQIVYETEALNNVSTGVYTINCTMPLHKTFNKYGVEHEYKVYGIKNDIQTVEHFSFKVL